MAKHSELSSEESEAFQNLLDSAGLTAEGIRKLLQRPDLARKWVEALEGVLGGASEVQISNEVIAPRPRITYSTTVVLQFLLRHGPAYGLQIIKGTGLRSGTVYPILHRLDEAGWVSSRREAVNPASVGRPARTHFCLTQDGRREAEAIKDKFGGVAR